MLRNVIRASRCLVRRQINTSVVVLQQHRVKLRNSFNVSTVRQLSSPSKDTESLEHIDQAAFEDICNETLESLCDFFEELAEEAPNLKGADITYSDGVLTISLGSSYGTYVINRQTPNKQIWLSSPVSGPKRYDLVPKNGGYWVYKHDGVTLHQLLQKEIAKIVDFKVDFKSCAHSS